jgi:hypothetical protein
VAGQPGPTRQIEEAIRLNYVRRVAYGATRELGEMPSAVPTREGGIGTAPYGQGVA